MNLKLHLIFGTVMVAATCLAAAGGYVLHASNRASRHAGDVLVEALSKQLEFQLQQSAAGFSGSQRFPDFELWKQTHTEAGVCVSFVAEPNGDTRSLCTGTPGLLSRWPAQFETWYRAAFSPGQASSRTIRFKGRAYGVLNVTVNPEREIARAWDDVTAMAGVSATTVAAVCLLVYGLIGRALRPAGCIEAGLARLANGELNYRLPSFSLNEWQRTATAINRLAAGQQQLLQERQQLAIKLIHLQEDERRFLLRELHDEFGQCLTALNALAVSVAQTAEQDYPQLATETDMIRRIGEKMLEDLRTLLRWLKPAELDELGLAAGLHALVTGWQGRSGEAVHYRLTLSGAVAELPAPVALALFRIVQESLTNVAKHANAREVSVQLDVSVGVATLAVTDDGCAERLPFAVGQGIGLAGMRERVAALGGRFSLSIVVPHGLCIAVRLPLIDDGTGSC